MKKDFTGHFKTGKDLGVKVDNHGDHPDTQHNDGLGPSLV
jgi:hypothetical protein